MMRSSESIAALAAALAQAQGRMKPAKMDGRNPHYGSRYATLASLIESIRIPFAEAGLAVVQGANEDGGIDTTILHASGEWITFRGIPMRPAKDDPQGIGSAMTYARRYGLAAAVGQVGDDDDDGNAASAALPTQAAARAEAPHGGDTPPVATAAPEVDPGLDKTPVEAEGIIIERPTLMHVKDRKNPTGPQHRKTLFAMQDDEGAKVDVACWHDLAESVLSLCIGDRVRVTGRWNVYRGRVSINAESVERFRDSNTALTDDIPF